MMDIQALDHYESAGNRTENEGARERSLIDESEDKTEKEGRRERSLIDVNEDKEYTDRHQSLI
jgi:hypothetical protein